MPEFTGETASSLFLHHPELSKSFFKLFFLLPGSEVQFVLPYQTTGTNIPSFFGLTNIPLWEKLVKLFFKLFFTQFCGRLSPQNCPKGRPFKSRRDLNASVGVHKICTSNESVMQILCLIILTTSPWYLLWKTCVCQSSKDTDRELKNRDYLLK